MRRLFGDFDICIFPIGAYSPAFLMQASHTNPEEALQAFTDLNGNVFIPMHYGTFDLSDEPPGEPIIRLRKSANELEISDKIKELAVGEMYLLSDF